MANDLKPLFQQLSQALMDLHRDLLMLEAKLLESESGRKLSPYDLLHASLHDPQLSWLRQISTLIVTVDTTIDEITNLTGQDANKIANEVLLVLEKPSDLAATDFWQKYSGYLSHNPDIIMKHSRVKELISQLRPKN